MISMSKRIYDENDLDTYLYFHNVDFDLFTFLSSFYFFFANCLNRIGAKNADKKKKAIFFAPSFFSKRIYYKEGTFKLFMFVVALSCCH